MFPVTLWATPRDPLAPPGPPVAPRELEQQEQQEQQELQEQQEQQEQQAAVVRRSVRSSRSSDCDQQAGGRRQELRSSRGDRSSGQEHHELQAPAGAAGKAGAAEAARAAEAAAAGTDKKSRQEQQVQAVGRSMHWQVIAPQLGNAPLNVGTIIICVAALMVDKIVVTIILVILSLPSCWRGVCWEGFQHDLGEALDALAAPETAPEVHGTVLEHSWNSLGTLVESFCIPLAVGPAAYGHWRGLTSTEKACKRNRQLGRGFA